MNKFFAWIVGGGIVLLLILFSTTYTVSFNEVAVVRRFGGAGNVVHDAGIKFKWPFFIDSVDHIDRRLQMVESTLIQQPTRDNQQIMVQAFMLWRVDTSDDVAALDFFESYKTVEAASTQLETQLQSAMSAIGSYDFDALIGDTSELDAAEQAILGQLKSSSPRGVLPVQVGISQLVLPPTTSVAVLNRMRAAQQTQAENERSRGQADANGIVAQANSQAQKIRSFANRLAADIRNRGNEEAARYLQEMNEAKDLAIFLTWLDAFVAAFSEGTTYVGNTQRAPAHLFDTSTPLDAETGIPMPAERWGDPLSPADAVGEADSSDDDTTAGGGS